MSRTRYVLHELLGRGGMGTVYAVMDSELGRLVALKVSSSTAAAPEIAERLRRESRILAQLEHPNIIPVHDAGLLPDGRTYYVMKLVRGERLDVHLARGLPLADRLQLFERICDALAFAHAHGVIHRDLKPANIMIGSFGEVLVLDWGIAKAGPETSRNPIAPTEPAAATGITGAGVVIGTHGYMSPEQARGDPAIDARSDIHALGLMLRLLIQEDSDVPGAAVERPRRDARVLGAIADRASAISVEARYQTVPELVADLGRFRNALPVEAYAESVVERLARVAGKYRVALALIVAYVVMRLVLLVATRAGS